MKIDPILISLGYYDLYPIRIVLWSSYNTDLNFCDENQRTHENKLKKKIQKIKILSLYILYSSRTWQFMVLHKSLFLADIIISYSPITSLCVWDTDFKFLLCFSCRQCALSFSSRSLSVLLDGY